MGDNGILMLILGAAGGYYMATKYKVTVTNTTTSGA